MHPGMVWVARPPFYSSSPSDFLGQPQLLAQNGLMEHERVMFSVIPPQTRYFNERQDPRGTGFSFMPLFHNQAAGLPAKYATAPYPLSIQNQYLAPLDRKSVG